MDNSFRWCSEHPGVAGMKAFWVDLSRYLLASMKPRNQFLIMAVNSLPMQDVRAIGLKLAGDDGSDVAHGFPSSLMAANFHVDGTAEVAQQRLNMLCRATKREGQFLKILYGIPSTGEGEELDSDLFTACAISAEEMSSSLKLTNGAGIGGIHDGLVKD